MIPGIRRRADIIRAMGRSIQGSLIFFAPDIDPAPRRVLGWGVTPRVSLSRSRVQGSGGGPERTQGHHDMILGLAWGG